jgi:hypothetical protein
MNVSYGLLLGSSVPIRNFPYGISGKATAYIHYQALLCRWLLCITPI